MNLLKTKKILADSSQGKLIKLTDLQGSQQSNVMNQRKTTQNSQQNDYQQISTVSHTKLVPVANNPSQNTRSVSNLNKPENRLLYQKQQVGFADDQSDNAYQYKLPKIAPQGGVGSTGKKQGTNAKQPTQGERQGKQLQIARQHYDPRDNQNASN